MLANPILLDSEVNKGYDLLRSFEGRRAVNNICIKPEASLCIEGLLCAKCGAVISLTSFPLLKIIGDVLRMSQGTIVMSGISIIVEGKTPVVMGKFLVYIPTLSLLVMSTCVVTVSSLWISAFSFVKTK